MPKSRFLRFLLLASLMGALLAGCGDDDDNSSGDTGGAGGSANEAAVADAKQFVERFMKDPTEIRVTAPLSKKPPTGKRIAWVACPTATCVTEGKGIAEAAALFGWTVEQTQYGLTPEAIQAAFTSAIDKKPDAVMTSATPTELTEGIRARLARENIPMFECCNYVPDGISNPPATVIMDQNLVAFYAEMLAKWQVAKTNGNVHNLTVTIPDFPILAFGAKAYDAALKSACPEGCTTKTLNVVVTDIGTKLPGQVVSELQRNPKINYVAIIGSGPMATGIAAALKEAGLSSQAKIVGTAPDTNNFDNMIAGDEEMWVGFSETMVGWRLVDLYARHLAGEKVALRASGLDDRSPAAWLPIQYITKDTWPRAERWEQPRDFRDQFKKLWKL